MILARASLPIGKFIPRVSVQDILYYTACETFKEKIYMYFKWCWDLSFISSSVSRSSFFDILSVRSTVNVEIPLIFFMVDFLVPKSALQQLHGGPEVKRTVVVHAFPEDSVKD